MYDLPGAIKAVISLVLSIALLIGCISLFINVVVPMAEKSDAESKMYAGEVVDKKVINARSGLFTSSDIDYRLTIKGSYEYDGKTYEGERSISVDKDIYQQANIGDWFDSHSLEVSKHYQPPAQGQGQKE